TLEAISCFEDIRRPLLLFFVGVPSSGKTQVIEFATPRDDEDPLAPYCYRSDKVTPKAFVSNRADLSPAQLAAVDLLPKIKDRLILTKELSPFFQGNRDQLLETFAVLASISDGTGFVVDTGAHGRRGYQEPINFRWCGATTPLSTGALCAMEVIGPRVLFYYVARSRKTDAELMADIQRRRTMVTPADLLCREAVAGFITTLHATYPPGSVRRSDIDFPRPALAQIARWGNALILLRGSIEAPEAGREHPERVVEQLEILATASALAH